MIEALVILGVLAVNRARTVAGEASRCRRSEDVVTNGALTAFLESAVRFATPLAYAALGELVVERAGVINIGLEGVIIGGAFGALVSAGAGERVVRIRRRSAGRRCRHRGVRAIRGHTAKPTRSSQAPR